jgi:putative aldouronate transport system permease protein
MKTEINKPIAVYRKKSISHYLKRDWQLYFLLIFPLACVILFKYSAYPGLRMAFMDYKPALGFARSPYVGFEVFQRIFKDADFLRALKNSLIFNVLDLAIGFPVPIILAIMINELKFPRFKKVTQTILYLPHFLSWVIVASVAFTLFKPETGLVNVLLINSGWIDKGIPFLTEKWHWSVSYILLAVWQSMGWGTIIYLAAITSISDELYEAATVDGAGRFKKIWHITLPGLRSTMVIMLILALGRLMGSNYERLYAFDNVQVKDFQYQLAVYIYDKGLASGLFNKATAVGLFQNVIGLILILTTDKIAKKLGEDGLI